MERNSARCSRNEILLKSRFPVKNMKFSKKKWYILWLKGIILYFLKWFENFLIADSPFKCSLGNSSWAPAVCSKALYEINMNVNCALRYPPWACMLRCSLRSSFWAPAFWKAQYQINITVNFALSIHLYLEV